MQLEALQAELSFEIISPGLRTFEGHLVMKLGSSTVASTWIKSRGMRNKVGRCVSSLDGAYGQRSTTPSMEDWEEVQLGEPTIAPSESKDRSVAFAATCMG